MNSSKKYKDGIIFTLLFHFLVLLILLLLGIFPQSRIPEDKGMLIDFGMTDQGMGITEPTPKELSGKEEIPPVSSPKTVKEQRSNKAKEKIVTQDFEKTAIVNEQGKEENARKQLENKRKRDSLERINRELVAEQNRLSEIRRQDSIRKAQEAASIAQMNSKAKNAFGVSGQGTDPNSQGQGNGNRPGNFGSPDGVPGGGTGGGTGSGNGNGSGNGTGAQINYSLTGRKVMSLQKPSYPGNEEGIVVVKITVDKNGAVTQAEPGVQGTKTPNQGLWEAARQAALKTKFFQSVDAPAFQTGTITYKFVLN